MSRVHWTITIRCFPFALPFIGVFESIRDCTFLHQYFCTFPLLVSLAHRCNCDFFIFFFGFIIRQSMVHNFFFRPKELCTYFLTYQHSISCLLPMGIGVCLFSPCNFVRFYLHGSPNWMQIGWQSVLLRPLFFLEMYPSLLFFLFGYVVLVTSVHTSYLVF